MARQPDTSGRTRLALLSLIRDGIFVSRLQVLALCKEYGIHSGASSTNELLRTLVRAKLIAQEVGDSILARVVYTITRKGLSVLEHNGDGLASVTSQSDVLADPVQMVHFLFINELRVALLPHITNWVCEPHVRSLRITNQIAFAKDYDAVVELKLGGIDVRFAIEYELSRKSQDRYEAIARTVQYERNVDAILYLASSPALLTLIATAMDQCPNVCLANAKIFQSQLLLTEIATGRADQPSRAPFKTFLATRLAARGRR